MPPRLGLVRYHSRVASARQRLVPELKPRHVLPHPRLVGIGRIAQPQLLSPARLIVGETPKVNGTVGHARLSRLRSPSLHLSVGGRPMLKSPSHRPKTLPRGIDHQPNHLNAWDRPNPGVAVDRPIRPCRPWMNN